MTEDEIIEIISAATTMLGGILAQHIELNESIEGAGIETQKLKMDSLKSQLADEKLKLAKLKAAAKRKKELEKSNRDNSGTQTNESSTTTWTPIRLSSGKIVGFKMDQGPDRTDYFNGKGKYIGREINGATYDARGYCISFKQRVGMLLLADHCS